jgi:DNA-directed RNA polymerase specialized sigma subunit
LGFQKLKNAEKLKLLKVYRKVKRRGFKNYFKKGDNIMNFNKAKNKEKIKFLKWYLEAKHEYMQILEEFEMLKSKIESPTISQLSDMPKNLTVSNNKFDNYLIVMEKYTEKIKTNLENLLNIKLNIETNINNLSESRERLILRYRYIEGLKWEEICVKMNYTWQHCHRIHGYALHNLKCDIM